jgi:hypothetical protein
MRLIFGIILGAALTVGTAYVSDTSQKSDADRMVNWQVVAKNVDAVTAMVKQGWAKLTS